MHPGRPTYPGCYCLFGCLKLIIGEKACCRFLLHRNLGDVIIDGTALVYFVLHSYHKSTYFSENFYYTERRAWDGDIICYTFLTLRNVTHSSKVRETHLSIVKAGNGEQPLVIKVVFSSYILLKTGLFS